VHEKAWVDVEIWRILQREMHHPAAILLMALQSNWAEKSGGFLLRKDTFPCRYPFW
jgi:hypothetical protein